MFKGNNVLELNAATVIEAVQEYLNKRIIAPAPPPKIMSVSYTGSVYRFYTTDAPTKSQEKQ
jgi:hypothetical protein